MSTPDERTHAFLREALARRPRPSLPADLPSRVLRRVAARERERAAHPTPAALLLLSAYWLLAGLASLWILARIELPAWLTAALWVAAAATVPAGYAAALWPDRARVWLMYVLRPLALPPER